MKDEINIINFNNKIPLSFSILRFDSIFRHMHSSCQLLLILEGECDIYVDDKQYHGVSNDMIIINSKTFHHLISEKSATIISILIDQKGFMLDDDEAESLSFNLNTMEHKKNPRYDQIRYLVYSIIKYNMMENVNSIYTNRAIAFSFFSQLINDFKVSKSGVNKEEKDSLDTINKINAYVNDHYKEIISLNSLAKEFNYSISYLSRLYKATCNQTFTEYYDHLRVNYAMNDLLQGVKTINAIAEEHGFENIRSFVRAFKNIYNLTPSEYRLKHVNSSKHIKLDPKLFQKRVLDKILAQYDMYGTIHSTKEESARETEILASINFNSVGEKLKLKGNEILELNGPSDLLNEEINNALKITQKEIGFNYIMVPHLLARRTHILNKNENDEWALNFVYFDHVIKKIFELDAKPFLVFEYNQTLLKQSEFNALLIQILDYLSTIYSSKLDDAMISFTFTRSATNKPSLYNNELQSLYASLYNIFRKSLPNIKIGTPIFYKDDLIEDKEYLRFLKSLIHSEINYDFIAIRYCYDFTTDTYLTKNKHELSTFVEFLKDKDLYIPNKMCLCGYNFTNNNSLLNDTLYASSFYIQNYLENEEKFSYYSKSSFMDRTSLSAYDPNPFHGENGMFTYNYIKKASYNALYFISKLKGEILRKEKNYIVCATDRKITIILNNYNHYSELFADKEYFEISNLNRYNCFPKGTNINFKFSISNIPSPNCVVKISSITKSSGSSYDKWLTMGAQKYLTNDELRLLKNLSEISYVSSEEFTGGDELNLSVTVAPLESKLVEIYIN